MLKTRLLLALLLMFPLLLGTKCNGCGDPQVCLDCRRAEGGPDTICPGHTAACRVQLATNQADGFRLTGSTFVLHDFCSSQYQETHADHQITVAAGTSGSVSYSHGTTFGGDRSLLGCGGKFIIDGTFEVKNLTTGKTATISVPDEDITLLDCQCNGVPCESPACCS